MAHNGNEVGDDWLIKDENSVICTRLKQATQSLDLRSEGLILQQLLVYSFFAVFIEKTVVFLVYGNALFNLV